MNFFDKHQKLIKFLPVPALYGGRSEEVFFSDNIWHSYNSYYCFDGGRLRDSAYMYNCTGADYNTFCVDCFDCDQCNSCERCYECSVAHHCYNCRYLEYCNRLTDCHFCIHCRNSQDLFGCVELEYKRYCIFNVQHTETDYKRIIKKLLKQPAKSHLKRIEKLKVRTPQPWMRVTRKSENSFGDYVMDCKNCYFCFFTTKSEDCAYLFNSQFNKDCFDGNLNHMCELCYECPSIGHSYSCSFSTGDYLTDCHFCTYCFNSQNLFGCVNLKNARFCILNTQYSEKKYYEKVNEIRKQLNWPKVKTIAS